MPSGAATRSMASEMPSRPSPASGRSTRPPLTRSSARSSRQSSRSGRYCRERLDAPGRTREPNRSWRDLSRHARLGGGDADANAVKVAVPAIGRDLDASISALQWTLTSYLLTVAALLLLSGALADRFGRR